MNNQEIAQVFANIADMLQIKGDVVFKIRAYQRAAETLRDYGRDLNVVWREGKLRDIPGVGAAIADKIDELLRTGKLGFYERLQAEVPLGVLALMQVPDVGPKKAALIWSKLGILNVPELEQAARAGKLRGLPGMGEKSEAKILAGIEALARRAAARRPLGPAWDLAHSLAEFLRGLPGVQQAEVAGSVRRRRATIGDLDFLVAANDAEPIMAAFVSYPAVARVLAHGPTKSSVELGSGLQADLRVLPAERWGTLLQYFTGSQAHNVKLRELAQRQGLSLSDRAILRADGSEMLCATEEEVYAALGLPWIPPELREDRGEIDSARRGRLPRLVALDDLVSELHAHTTWSDGALSVAELAEAALAAGLKCLAVTDHSQSLGITNGLSPERLRAQRLEVDAAQAALGSRLMLLQGTEMEIRADGQLDYSDEVLAGLDIVIASLHTGLRQPREQVTARLLSAITNPHVDIIGHPTGRLLPDREGADLDMEAVLPAAAAAGVALEINANPARLDLDDPLAFRALELGCLLSINTDAHFASNFDLAHFGVSLARRAWASPEQVINTWPPDRLRAWLARRGARAEAPADLGGTPAQPPVVPATSKPARKRAVKGTSAAAKKAARETPLPKAPARKAARKRAGPQ